MTLCDAFREEELPDGETRVVLKLLPSVAPYKITVLPLTKKLEEKAHEVETILRKYFSVSYDETGSIGKRYRRADAIGTPFCVTVDFESLEDAICELLSGIKKVLSDINPEIMIEFRQPYIGPIMRKYGNMLRVADCPMDALKNRAGIVDLKMTSGNTAVHSDMLMWNYDDTPESAALQIINIMFGVPQISVLIENLSEEHKNVLKFYLSLWNKNRECLVNGKLSAYNPETGYSFISSETETTLIAASYVKNILKIEKAYKKVIFVNGSWDEKLLVDNNLSDFNAEYNIYNCMGEIVNSGTISIINGINCFEVPNSGMLELHIK
jgi:alpha-galactosidase